MSAVKFHSTNGSAVMTEGLEGRYRELLIRRLPGDGRPLVFCMLNPSTADHSADDPTIRRCIGFAMRENANALIVKLFRRYNVETLCVGQTRFGKPRHPLYVRADQPLIPYTGD